MRPYLLIAILLVGAGAVARGDTLTFTNAAGSGLWSDPLNWDALRVPTGADDVVVPAGSASCRITTPSACNGMNAGALVVFDAPTQINGPSTFSAGVQLNSTITGNGDLTFASAVDWRAGSLEGAGLALVPEGVTMRVVPEGQPTLSRVLEVFGTSRSMTRSSASRARKGCCGSPTPACCVWSTAAPCSRARSTARPS